jgi:branched-chain amino acid aminotransferase
MKRFATSARAIGLELPGGIAAARAIVLETARAFDADDAYVRLIASRGEGPLGIDPTQCLQPRLVCIVDQIAVFSKHDSSSAGLLLLTSSLRRPSADVLDPRVKSLNYLNNVLARAEAVQRGGDEALLLNQAGHVVEASAANIFAVRDGELLTPLATDGALDGITRATVLEIADALGIPTQERTLGRMDLLSADEVFLSGSGAGLVPVLSLDGRVIGAKCPGPILEMIRAKFIEEAPGRGIPF